jgi:hypothetical protein
MNGIAPRRGRNRRQVSSALQPIATNAVPTITVSTVTVSIAFSKPMIFNGVPATFTVADVTVQSITVVDAQHCTLTLSGSGAGKAYELDANDPAFRTYQGGYAAPAAGTFPV